ncbi:MAG: putative immunity protein [Verrucomicrobiota bacterium]
MISWAHDCAHSVLSIFETVCPKDKRPRKALRLARALAKDRSCFRMKDVREAALGAHAAARKTQDRAARAAARSAAHAAAAEHVKAHARGAVLYATKAITESGSLVDLKSSQRLHRLPRRFHEAAYPPWWMAKQK